MNEKDKQDGDKISEVLDFLNAQQAEPMPEKIEIEDFMQDDLLENIENKSNFIEHLLTREDGKQRISLLNLVEPTLKRPNVKVIINDNGIIKEKHIKKFSNGKDFFYLLASMESGKILLTGFATNALNTIKKELKNADTITTCPQ